MYDEIYPEVKYGEENSRIDFLLKSEGLPDCYVEVKSITFVKGTLGMFPDAVTTRGQKHVRELLAMKKQGHRAVVLFAGLHDGFDRFKIAEFIDPEYDRLLKNAKSQGVEAYAYAGKFEISDGIPTALFSYGKCTLHRLKIIENYFHFSIDITFENGYHLSIPKTNR